jgi:hypothetical protein
LCRRLPGLHVLLALLIIGFCAPLASSSETPPIRITQRFAQLNCTVAALPENTTVTLELRYETHDRSRPPGYSPPGYYPGMNIISDAAELRRALEQPKKPSVRRRPFNTASWRIIRTTFEPDAFFGEPTRRACRDGCALKEHRSIDMWRRVFVASPATGAPLNTRLDLSDLEREYRQVRRGLLTFAGFGDAENFGFHFEEYSSDGVHHTRAICR